MRKDSFLLAESSIIAYLHNHNTFAYTYRDIEKIFHNNKENWNIAGYRTVKHFVNFITEKKILELVKLKHLTKGSLKQVFIIPGENKFYVAQTVKKEGYISFYSALQFHDLTLQNSKSVYISYDKYYDTTYSGFADENDSLTQDSIDKAFSKPQRQTSEIFRSEKDDIRYFFIQKKATPVRVGIEEANGIYYTDLERTLIDIAIRPAYSGGVFDVLEAFIMAHDRINVARMVSYLDQLDYVYPYHQLIGFYLEKSGMSDFETSLFYEKKTDLKFYLTYNISNKRFDEKWNIYYPNGF